MATAAPDENPSILRTWAALAAVSLGIFAITLDGSMMPVAIGAIVNGLDTEVGAFGGHLHSGDPLLNYRHPRRNLVCIPNGANSTSGGAGNAAPRDSAG